MARYADVLIVSNVSYACLLKTGLLSQVDFNAKSEYEYVNNYKLLQAAFTKLGIDKVNHANAWHCTEAYQMLLCMSGILDPAAFVRAC